MPKTTAGATKISALIKRESNPEFVLFVIIDMTEPEGYG